MTLAATGATTLVMSVHNPTAGRRTFCTYHTPFEGIRNDIFVVMTAAGVELDYRGMMAKRVAPDASDHVTLAPGKTAIAEEVDLASVYALSGPCSIRYRGTGISGLGDSAPITLG